MARVLKWLAGLVVAAGLGWTGWWFLGSEGQKAGIEAWLEAQRQRGWTAEVGALDVQGYPLDFKLQAADIEMADPRAGWLWRAPEIRAESRSYAPTRIAVTWPRKQVFGGRFDMVSVTSDSMTTLLDLRPGSAMELREAASDVTALRMVAGAGWKAGAEALGVRVAERAEDAPPNTYDLNLKADSVDLPRQLVARIDPTGFLKPKIDRFTVLANGTFDRALGRETVERGDIRLRRATIREAGFQWGEMRLSVSGAFDVDERGFPVGQIKIEAKEWPQMVRLAVRSGIISAGMGRQVEQAIKLFVGFTGGGNDLSAPLGLADGKIKLGPFAIADAPRFKVPRDE